MDYEERMRQVAAEKAEARAALERRIHAMIADHGLVEGIRLFVEEIEAETDDEIVQRLL